MWSVTCDGLCGAVCGGVCGGVGGSVCRGVCGARLFLGSFLGSRKRCMYAVRERKRCMYAVRDSFLAYQVGSFGVERKKQRVNVVYVVVHVLVYARYAQMLAHLRSFARMRKCLLMVTGAAEAWVERLT